MPIDWSRPEVERTVSDYLDMLRMQLADEPFNKAERNRRLQEVLQNRSRGSVEYKHQNISAVLIELGLPYVDGYKPLRNYQDLLREVVAEHLSKDSALAEKVRLVVEADVAEPGPVDDVLAILIDPPIRDDEPRTTGDRQRPARPAIRATNFLEREARNRSLGRAGEELALQFEHERLWRAGQKRLAERIEHISVTQGDGAGYDIASFETSGSPRLIEVKTTRFGSMTPFFATRNEIAVSAERETEFCLYRICRFTDQPKLFMLPGAIANSCDLEAIEFRASIR